MSSEAIPGTSEKFVELSSTVAAIFPRLYTSPTQLDQRLASALRASVTNNGLPGKLSSLLCCKKHLQLEGYFPLFWISL